jgi:hypothetical protein
MCGAFFRNSQFQTDIPLGAMAPRKPTFTTTGRILFQEYGAFGTLPTTGPVANTRAQLYQANGYYMVKVGSGAYDMVSVADAKNWVSWGLAN